MPPIVLILALLLVFNPAHATDDESIANGEQLQRVFQQAVRDNDVPAVQKWLAYLTEIQNDDNHSHGKPTFDPCWNGNEAMQIAGEFGYADMMRVLLAETECDPGERFNLPLRLAAKNGHAEVVELLMNDTRVNPADFMNLPILEAAGYGHPDVVRLLLRDERVRPDMERNMPLKHAAGHGYIEVCRLLLQDWRVNPTASRNQALRFAGCRGQWQVVEMLATDERVDPSLDNNSALFNMMDVYREPRAIHAGIQRSQAVLLRDVRVLRLALRTIKDSGVADLLSLPDDTLLSYMGFFLTADRLGDRRDFSTAVGRAVHVLRDRLPWLQRQIKEYFYHPDGPMSRLVVERLARQAANDA